MTASTLHEIDFAVRYYVAFGSDVESSVAVDVAELPSGEVDVRIEGRRVDVDVTTLGNVLSARVEGRIVDLTTEGRPPEVGAVACGHRLYVRVESERQRVAASPRRANASSSKTIASPMPGRIIRVCVAAGSEVLPGQTLGVVEAMKMENEIKSKEGGVVSHVHVAEGATVEAGARLFTLE